MYTVRLGAFFFLLLSAGLASIGVASDGCSHLLRSNVFAKLYKDTPRLESMLVGPLGARTGNIESHSALGQFRNAIATMPLENNVNARLGFTDDEFSIGGGIIQKEETLTINILIAVQQGEPVMQPSQRVRFGFIKFVRAIFLGLEDRILSNPGSYRWVEINAQSVVNNSLVGMLKEMGFTNPSGGGTYTLKIPIANSVN